jgi:hypothetical protein
MNQQDQHYQNQGDQNQSTKNQYHPNQPQVIIVNNQQKSQALGFILALFFGPLGLLYSSITAGIIMFIIDIPVFFLSFGFGLLLTNFICAILALYYINKYNAKQNQMMNKR